jgi:hypothetical protein
MVMSNYRPRTLRSELNAGRLPVAEAVALGVQLSGAPVTSIGTVWSIGT